MNALERCDQCGKKFVIFVVHVYQRRKRKCKECKDKNWFKTASVKKLIANRKKRK